MILLIPLTFLTTYLFGFEYFVILCASTMFGGVYEHFAYYMASYLENKTSLRPFGAPTKKILDNPIMIGYPVYTIGHYLVVFTHSFVSIYIDNVLFNCLFYVAILTLVEYIAGRLLGAGSVARDGKIIKGVWDYSDEPYNLHGIISLRHFVIWSLASLLSLYSHPRIINFIRKRD
ncbi:protein of unknown function DUF1113 [Yasminevirus sp. GU-2018]|uniref:Uncharacterized protein n=1 Tax=Yasminevirus sp. GU-2018 TaxID=2420051 RepID=A0A5K0U9U1_9VIRU|nr:protein of unknown function DUF1113 [Yasminevirus sp. GU-2018]